MLGILAMGAPEKGNPTNMVSPSCQELDDHSLIITLQRKMNTLKQRNTQEMENPQKENTTVREQHLKLQEDQNLNLITATATHPTKIDEADTTWRDGTLFVTQSVQIATNADTWLHPFIDGIMEAWFPPGWKTLIIDRYDGLSNPDEHVDAFITQQVCL